MNDDRSPRAHLGVAWPFPVKPVNGRLNYVSYDDDIVQSIRIILGTEHGERLMLPDFGAGLRRFLFEPDNTATCREVEREVQEALRRHEPRIDVEAVTAVPDPDEVNVLRLEIDYVVRATNTFYNRVFPFYLHEGG